jgi:hypothetical protein
LTKIKNLRWRDVAVPEQAAPGLWCIAPSIIGTYEMHRFDDRDGVFLGKPNGIALTQYKDAVSAMNAADEHFKARIETVLVKNDRDIVARLEALALTAETANHHIQDMRVMPAAGVADLIYEAMDIIVDLRIDLDVARGDATEAETFAEELLDGAKK